MIEKVKLALRIKTNAYDSELSDLINAAEADLAIVGVKVSDTDPLIQRAVITYCRWLFSADEYMDKYKASYDEQKAQLITATGYGFEKVDDNI